MPKFDNTKTEDLSEEQVKALFKILDNDSNRQAAIFMKIALFTGLRRGEIIKLKWSDIDFERGFITLSPNKGGLQENIPLNSHVIAAINELKSISFESDYLFPAKDGGQRERFSFDKPLIRFRKEAGLPADFRPMHGSRHYFASTLASSGKIDMYTLQKLLTHKSPKMTQRYAHLRDEAIKKALDQEGFERLFASNFTWFPGVIFPGFSISVSG